MFRECLEMASVDAVLNLVNIRPQRRVTVQQEPAPEQPAEQPAQEAAPAQPAEDKKDAE
jgi:hypothetical protein